MDGSASENLDRIGRAMMQAWARVKKAQTRMWGEWMTVGEGLLEGRRWAMQTAGTNRPEGKGFVMAYSEWLRRYKVDDLDKSDRAKLLQLMEERPGVEEWRASLTDYERRNLNNPIVVWRKWTAATRVKKPKPRTAGVPASEHGRARVIIEQLQARNSELTEELEAVRGTAAEDSTSATPEALLAAIDRVMTLGAQETAWPKGQTKECKKLLNGVRLLLLKLHAKAQPQRVADDPLSSRSGTEIADVHVDR